MATNVMSEDDYERLFQEAPADCLAGELAAILETTAAEMIKHGFPRDAMTDVVCAIDVEPCVDLTYRGRRFRLRVELLK